MSGDLGVLSLRRKFPVVVGFDPFKLNWGTVAEFNPKVAWAPTRGPALHNNSTGRGNGEEYAKEENQGWRGLG